MQELSFNQYLSFVAAFLALIPALVLLRYYRRTRVFEYLLFSTFLFTGCLILLADPIAELTNNLLFYQVHSSSIDFALFLLFLHGLRTHKLKHPLIVTTIGISWFLILTIMTAFWQLMQQPD